MMIRKEPMGQKKRTHEQSCANKLTHLSKVVILLEISIN